MINIVAASIVRNAGVFLRPMITSLRWVDAHVIVDDHSTDGTSTLLEILAEEDPRLRPMQPWFSGLMLPIIDNRRDVSAERDIRNHFLDALYVDYRPDALVLVDADELMHGSLRQLIERVLREGNADAIALECNHLVSGRRRLRFLEQCWNGVKMIDPHVRVLLEKRYYKPGAWDDVPDPFIEPTERTRCANGLYHFHLKYLRYTRDCDVLARLPDYLQKRPESVLLESLPATLPPDVAALTDQLRRL